jgi:hypothetical protein
MRYKRYLIFVLAAPCSALVRFHCSQLVIERLDPLVTPGLTPSPHVHQIVGSYSFVSDILLSLTQITAGGNSFNATMQPGKDMPSDSTCTSCQFADDFSNVCIDPTVTTDIELYTAYLLLYQYWTAVLYFRAQNGTYKRVPQLGNNQFQTANGGITLYYMQDAIYDPTQKSKVTAFQPVTSPLLPPPLPSFNQPNPSPHSTYTDLHTYHRASACSLATLSPALSPPPPSTANSRILASTPSPRGPQNSLRFHNANAPRAS